MKLAEPWHEMPRKPERLLPKFDLDKPDSPKDHINNLFLATRLLVVCYHEDVVCRLFPYTFVGKASTWYFNPPLDSISTWEEFEKAFIREFGEEKSPATLYKELGAIKIEKKEKVKEFNQRFTTVLSNFYAETIPLESLRIEYYTSYLIPSIGMFFKRIVKESLAHNFDEA
jgi:hypothetical protein